MRTLISIRSLTAALLATCASASFLGCAVQTEAQPPEESATAGEERTDEAAQALTSVTNTCTCVGSSTTGAYCGNNAIGGDPGTTFTGISTANVISQYGPDRIGSVATGWACRVEGTNSCVCVGSSLTGVYCGNNAIGGNPGTTFTGISTANVISQYGPDRRGSAATGWACRLSGI